MEKRLKSYTKWGMLLVAFLGILLHFLYEFTGKSMWAGFFSPINESVWEHMKLAFFPLVVYVLYELWISQRFCWGFFWDFTDSEKR